MNAGQFSVTSHQVGDAAVIFPRGYFNNLSGEGLVRECSSYVNRGTTKIVVNFSQVDLINSIGISMLLQIVEDFRKVKGTVCFSDLSKLLKDTLEMLGLLPHLLVFPTEKEALAYLKKNHP